jgi:hypothetical protein
LLSRKLTPKPVDIALRLKDLRVILEPYGLLERPYAIVEQILPRRAGHRFSTLPLQLRELTVPRKGQ